MLYLLEYFLCRFNVPVLKSSIAAIAAGSHPDSFRTQKLSLLTSDAVLRYASSRETSNAAIVWRWLDVFVVFEGRAKAFAIVFRVTFWSRRALSACPPVTFDYLCATVFLCREVCLTSHAVSRCELIHNCDNKPQSIICFENSLKITLLSEITLNLHHTGNNSFKNR